MGMWRCTSRFCLCRIACASVCVPSCRGALVGFLWRRRLIGLVEFEVQARMLCLCVMVDVSASSIERAERIRRLREQWLRGLRAVAASAALRRCAAIGDERVANNGQVWDVCVLRACLWWL